MIVCQNKFWLFRLQELFCDYSIFPTKYMTLEKKMNSLTRFILFIFLVLYIFNVKNLFWYFLFSLLIIIIIYFIQKNKMLRKENYELLDKNEYSVSLQKNNTGYLTNNQIKDNVMSQKNNLAAYQERHDRYCNRNELLPLNETQVFKEKFLTGPPNPQTNFNLYIEPRPFDVNAWRDDQFVNYEAINSYKPYDLYGSGYIPKEYKSKPLYDISDPYDNEEDMFIVPPKYPDSNSFINEIKDINKEYPPLRENYEKENKYNKGNEKQLKEEYSNKNIYSDFKMDEKSVPPYYFSNGVNLNNTKYNIPINYPATPMQLREQQKDMNNEIFTVRLTPTLANQYEVVHPNNSNLSVDTVLQKREQIMRKENGKTIFTSIPPMDTKRNILKNPFKGDISPIDAVYDSVSVGYGPSYRSYYEPVSGTMRYYYDDIDAARNGTILTENKIDIFEGSMNRRGQVPGPLYDLNEMRKVEQNRWLDMTAFHRESMQSSLMEYVGDKEWQTKMAPTYGSI
jgi:hypothetical protein